MKVNKLLLICSLGMLFFGCDSKEKDALQTENEELRSTVKELSERVEKLTSETDKMKLELEMTRENTDLVFKAGIKKIAGVIWDTTIRVLPDSTSQAICSLKSGPWVTIRGFSDKKETVSNREGYWAQVEIGKNDILNDYYAYNTGWIFVPHLNNGNRADVSSMKVLNVETDEKGNPILNLEFDRNGYKSTTLIHPRKISYATGYFFTWSHYSDGFKYSDPVGTFKWNPETNEITHVSLMGDHEESAWCFVSDDGKYFFQDVGTGPGVRTVLVCDNKTTKRLAMENYLYDLEFDGKSIVIVDNDCEESKRKKAEYIETIPSDKQLRYYEFDVKYKLDLETLNKTFLDFIVYYNGIPVS